MKTLIFSDSHLNGFQEKKYRFIEGIIRGADNVIINGDFWEGYAHPFDSFLNSPWKGLFPLLKQKKTVYVYGNHDKSSLSDKRAALFSVEQVTRYTVKGRNYTYVIEHGNRLCPFWDERRSKLTQFIKWEEKVGDTVQKIVVQRMGKKAMQAILQPCNNRIKKKLKKELKKDEIYVCGHTHLAETDLQNQFINSGMIKYGLGQYLIFENGEITAHEEWYQ